MTSLDIVIVNWNAGDRLRDCLGSLQPAVAHAVGHGIRVDRVVVVDNGSEDGSADRLPAAGLPLIVVRNPDNRGFAAACNQGAAASHAGALLFLNPDTLVAPDSLTVAVTALADPAHAQVGILGVKLIDEDGTVARRCARFPAPARLIGHAVGLDRVLPRLVRPHFLTEWDHATTRPVDQVMGAFFLIRQPVFAALGGFDERFFVYFEDVDLSLRARERGWTSLYLASTAVRHAGGGSSRRIPARRLFYVQRSRLLYVAKHFGRGAAVAVAAATLALEPLARLVHGALRRDIGTATAGLAAAGLTGVWIARLTRRGWRLSARFPG